MTPFARLRLSTARLRLRPLVPGDEADLFALYGDPLAMRYWSAPAWASPAQGTAMIAADRADMAGRRHLRLGLVPRQGEAAGRVVGTVSLFDIDAVHRRAEIGYALARAHQGRGLMHEALQALVAAAFDHDPGAPFDDLRLHRLQADADPRNAASCRTLERLGFRLEGLLRERWRVADEVSDSALHGLLRPDWQAARARAPARARFDGVVRALSRTDLAAWLAHRVALWPQAPAAEHEAEMSGQLADPRQHAVLGAFGPDAALVGFAEVALRHDYVNGTAHGPVGFLEGLYVAPAARRLGVARALVESAVAWSREHGAREFASDVQAANAESLAVHRALGFQETERVVYFRWSA